jgi:hypothetical protein
MPRPSYVDQISHLFNEPLRPAQAIGSLNIGSGSSGPEDTVAAELNAFTSNAARKSITRAVPMWHASRSGRRNPVRWQASCLVQVALHTSVQDRLSPTSQTADGLRLGLHSLGQMASFPVHTLSSGL